MTNPVTRSHHSTIQISSVVLQPRHDLAVSVREFGGQPVYVIEDEINSRFFRIGHSEYTFLSMLDGDRTFADALGRTASLMKEDALTESEAAAFCRWLIENRLASTRESESSARLFEAHEQVRRRKWKSWLNPIFLRVPLLHPDGAFRIASSLFGWLFAWPAFLGFCLVVAAAALTVCMNWSAVASSSAQITSQFNWLWLLAAWLVMKVVHEAAHGIACRHFGGAVREAGVLLLLFIPLPYVDVTSAWRFDSKWQRMLVSFAGMYAELFLAAVAALVWGNTEPSLLHQHAFHVMLSGSVVTLLFNANPLMRFDGYYILTDLVELPNLAAHGQQSLMKIGRRVFFGLPTNTSNWPEGRAGVVLIYGLLALVWRILVCLGIVFAADALYFGAGLVLAVTAVILWVVVPAIKLLRFVVLGSKTEQPRRAVFVAVTASLVAAGFAVWTFVPWHSRFEAPAVVEFETRVEVRAGVSGFVESLDVHDGQRVEAGDLLAVLRSPKLAAQRHGTLTSLRESQQRARQLYEQEQVAAWQVEQEREAALRKQLNELDEQHLQLEIRAPITGIVVESSLPQQRRAYLKRGERLLTIGDDRRKQVLALIDLQDADDFLSKVGSDVAVHVLGAGTERIRGQLLAPLPRASTEIVHDSFAASLGGPIPTVKDGARSTEAVRFAKPQLRAIVEVEAAFLKPILTGRSAVVTFRQSQGTVGEVLHRKATRWFLERCKGLQDAYSY